jgi:predicted TIM-barrel fold metal-dependent hydrolase
LGKKNGRGVKMKIDIFTHIVPPKYRQAAEKKLSASDFEEHDTIYKAFPALIDLEERFRLMDEWEPLRQVLTLTHPFVETVADPKVAVELARVGNDELAELLVKYPDRFVAAIGSLPMNDVSAALKELDRIVKDLHLKGVQLCTDINGKPLDSTEFMPLYERLNRYKLAVYIHPYRPETTTDYKNEHISKYRIFHTFGWPYDTTAAMVHLVFGHILEKFPDIRFITHHCGGMIPFFEQRLSQACSTPLMSEHVQGFSKLPFEYFKMFYADTALSGSTPGLRCGFSFFGADHILFGTDMPYGRQKGRLVYKVNIDSVERMHITDVEKKKIFEDNAKAVLSLSI